MSTKQIKSSLTDSGTAIDQSYVFKHDYGKVRPGLVLCDMAEAMVEISRIGTYGVVKYEEGSWRDVPNAERRYEDALLRHFLADKYESSIDEESGMLHLAHAAWNAVALLQLRLIEMHKQEGEVCQ